MQALIGMIWLLNALEILACVFAFAYWRKLKNSQWKWLPFYLLAVVVIEFTGRLLANNNQFSANINMYKFIGFPVQFLFFFFMFYQYRYFQKKRYWILTAIVVYIFSIVFETFFISNQSYWFNSFSYSVGNLLLLYFLLFYFFRFVQSREILYYKYDIMFWFCLGLLIYYVGTLPYWALRNLLVSRYRSIFEIYSYIWLMLDYLMYLIFINGIVKCRLK